MNMRHRFLLVAVFVAGVQLTAMVQAQGGTGVIIF